MSSVECDLFRAINKARQREGLLPLEVRLDAVKMAQEQARDMGIRGYVSHDRPRVPDRRGESFKERVRRFRLPGSVAENISTSAGYDVEEALQKAVALWLKSPGHRQNILNPNYRSTGLGHYRWAEKIRTRKGHRTHWHDLWVQVFSSAPGERR